MLRAASSPKSYLLLFAVLLLLYCLGVVLSPVLKERTFLSENNGKIGIADFVVLYEAGVIAASGDRQRIYDPAVQLSWCNRIISPDRLREPMYIQSPPWFFTLMAPLSLIPIKPAYVLWTFFWTAAATIAMLLVLRQSGMQSRLDRALFVTFALASAPAVVSMKLGQTSLCLLTFVLMFCYCWRRRRDKQGALWLALSSFKVQYCLFLVLPAVAGARRRLLAWSILLGAILLSISLLDVGWQSFAAYPAWVNYVESSGAQGVYAEAMVNIRGLLNAYLPTKLAFQLSVAAMLAALLYLVWLWRRAAKLSLPGKDEWLLATTIALAVLTSPHTHYHDCVLLAAAAAVTLTKLDLNMSAGPLSYRVWKYLLLIYPMLSWLAYLHRADSPVPLLALANMAVALAAVAYCESLLRRPEAAVEPPTVTAE
ncbi:MAG TPA: glycosyltransferase family 87 protein [Candidatus Obscuribacterales bacterium]